MEDELFDFEKLKVYQKAIDYLDIVYDMIREFPREEMYALTDDFRRAAQSVALNVGEGSGGTKPEFRQFCMVARRSVRECIVCTTIAARRKYIDDDARQRSRSVCRELSKMLTALMKSLE